MEKCVANSLRGGGKRFLTTPPTAYSKSPGVPTVSSQLCLHTHRGRHRCSCFYQLIKPSQIIEALIVTTPARLALVYCARVRASPVSSPGFVSSPLVSAYCPTDQSCYQGFFKQPRTGASPLLSPGHAKVCRVQLDPIDYG